MRNPGGIGCNLNFYEFVERDIHHGSKRFYKIGVTIVDDGLQNAFEPEDYFNVQRIEIYVTLLTQSQRQQRHTGVRRQFFVSNAIDEPNFQEELQKFLEKPAHEPYRETLVGIVQQAQQVLRAIRKNRI